MCFFFRDVWKDHLLLMLTNAHHVELSWGKLMNINTMLAILQLTRDQYRHVHAEDCEGHYFTHYVPPSVGGWMGDAWNFRGPGTHFFFYSRDISCIPAFIKCSEKYDIHGKCKSCVSTNTFCTNKLWVQEWLKNCPML